MGVTTGEIINLEEGEHEEDEEDQEASKKREREGEPQKRAFAHFKSHSCLLLVRLDLFGWVTIACLGQPIVPFKHFHFGGSCCPSSCILPENEKGKIYIK